MPRCFDGLVSSTSFATSRSRELWWTPLIGTDGTPATEPTQAFQFLLIGPENPGSADLRRHPPQDPPAVMPVPQGVDRHLQFPRQVAQSPLVAAEVLGADPPSRSRAKQPPAHQELLDDRPSELRRAVWGMKAFAVEPPGDLSGRGPGSPQLDHAITQGLIIAELLIFLNGTTNLVPALQAASPADRHVDPLGWSADAHGDPFHQEPNDRLPVLDRGAGGMPQPRQVTGPRFDPLAVGGGRLSRRVGLEPVILFLQTALFPQGLLPAPLQLAGHQAVLGLDGVVLASRALGLDPRPFQPLLPVLVQPLAVALQIGNGLKTQLQLGRLENLQHLLGDQRLERAGGENLAERFAVFERSSLAPIIDRGSFGVVGDLHPPPAPAAIHRPLKSDGPPRGTPTAVGRQRLAARRSWLDKYRSQVM